MKADWPVRLRTLTAVTTRGPCLAMSFVSHVAVGSAHAQAPNSGLAVHERVAPLVSAIETWVSQATELADDMVTASQGLVGPLFCGISAALAAWLGREAWRGVTASPAGVIALTLAALLGTLAALWPGREVTTISWPALMATPLAAVAVSSVVVGWWVRDRLPQCSSARELTKIGLVAMLLGIAWNFVVMFGGWPNLAWVHVVFGVAGGIAGAVWLVASETVGKPSQHPRPATKISRFRILRRVKPPDQVVEQNTQPDVADVGEDGSVGDTR